MPASIAAEALVREAEESDLERVIDVLRAANAEFAPVLPPAFYRAYLDNVLDVRSRLHESLLLVAERDKRIVGTITLYPDASREDWGWPSHWSGIRAVAVEPAARGLGIGRQLAQACIDRSRASDALAACLHTATFMGAALAMYERLGFQRQPAFDRDVDAMFASESNGSRIVALGYVRDL